LQVAVPWLRDNGVCLDNIKVGVSTISQAGRGAFASRLLKEGTVVAPIPVHQYSHDEMEMDTDDRPDQLFLNYCFGHSQSSLLLCPYAGGAAFANHASGDKANVRLEWSSKLDSKHDQWSKVPVNHILDANAGLVLQFVATRDILPGDEILYDYGKEWDLAWKEHVKQFEAGDVEYKSAAEWNALNLPQLKTTTEEEESEPYPENLFLGVQMDYDSGIGADAEQDESGVTVKTVSCTDVSSSHASPAWPCQVLERVKTDLGADSYTIMLYNHPGFDEDAEYAIPSDVTVKVTGVPREGIVFVDQLESTDVDMGDAFRHEIRVPEGLFPHTWLDVKDEV
jgi:hypothetical protein